MQRRVQKESPGRYALQVVWVPQPKQVHCGDGHPFSRTEEHRQARRVGVSRAFGLFGLWHRGIYCAES